MTLLAPAQPMANRRKEGEGMSLSETICFMFAALNAVAALYHYYKDMPAHAAYFMACAALLEP